MKKFFVVLLCLCLCFSLALPCFASDERQVYSLSGQWKFNSTLTYPSFLPECAVGETLVLSDIEFDASGSHFTGFTIMNDFDEGVSLVYGGIFRYYYELSSWKFNYFRDVDFGSDPQLVTADFYHWFVSNAVPLICDGTSCSAADSDFDYVCDVCGLPIADSLRTYSYSESVTFRTSSGDFLKASYMSHSPIVIRGYIDGDSYRVDCEGPVWCVTYSSTNNYDWVQTSSSVSQTHLVSDDLEDEVISSSFSWYTSYDGELFFPLPLWVTVSNNSQGHLPLLSREVGGTMTTLALCGVGLVALLMVLNLFGKTLPTFRRK